MAQVVVGVFHTYSQAQAAVRELEISGITGEQVEVISGANEDVRGIEATGSGAEHSRDSLGERIAHFFRALTGSEHQRVHDYYVEDQEFYAGEVRQGRTMLIVRPLSERDADTAVDVMRTHGGAGVTGKKQPSVTRETSEPETAAPRAMGSTASSIGAPRTTTGNYQDDLEGRGKQLRTSGRGEAVRVYSTSTPLRESSQAQPIPVSRTTNYEADYRKHYSTAFAGTGAAYEDYSPAYEFGTRLARAERYRGWSYADAEPDLRREYEASYPGSAWERLKEAVRYGWDRVTGKRAKSAGL